MDIIARFKEKTKGKNLSVVLPEGRDERIIQAARRLKDEDIAQPTVLGTPEQLEAAMGRGRMRELDIVVTELLTEDWQR